ncbi:FAD dependent oxidoreductase, partial [Aureobasidium melanogenum]
QRKDDGTIVLGVSRSNPELSAETLAVRESFDDGAFNQEIVDDALKRFGIMFPECVAETERHGEGLDHAWTGIIAMTPDSVPYVGAIEELPGQYICAGFNGHGMARIFTCAPGLAKLMLGGSWEETGLPECFQYGKE